MHVRSNYHSLPKKTGLDTHARTCPPNGDSERDVRLEPPQRLAHRPEASAAAVSAYRVTRLVLSQLIRLDEDVAVVGVRIGVVRGAPLAADLHTVERRCDPLLPGQLVPGGKR